MTDRWRPWKFTGKYLFAAIFVVAGVGHFALTEFFAKIVPPYLPYPRELVWVSGAFEVALGVMLLIPRTTRLAAWGLVALLIAVFPANFSMYQHSERFPSIPPTALLLRLPIQGLLILWALTYAGRPGPSRAEAEAARADR